MVTELWATEYERALAENQRYAAQFDRSGLPLPPGRKLAVQVGHEQWRVSRTRAQPF